MAAPHDDGQVGRPAHWDRRYENPYESLSWHQDEPGMSLALLDLAGVGPAQSVVDIGGGTSLLVDRLLERGHRDVTVLDVSALALETARARLGLAATLVRWVEADVTTWVPGRRYGVWHDRAVFHFLVDDGHRRHYLEALDAAVGPGGVLVAATFAPDGPTTCSGLPVRRYGPEELGSAFGAAWRLEHTEREEHRTPSGAVQPFTWVLLRRR